MQQRQLRLGDILDDYCPRERRVTNHAVVAMVGDDVKQTRCTTCDAEHEYKHAKVPRQRRKTETPAALYAQVLATGPKRVTHEAAPAANAPRPPSAVEPDADEDDRIDRAESADVQAVADGRSGRNAMRARRDADESDDDADDAEPRRRGRARCIAR